MQETLQTLVDDLFSWKGAVFVVVMGLFYWVPWHRIWKRRDGSG